MSEPVNCGLVGCMRCGNVPTPEQQAEISKRHEAKMRANAEAFAKAVDALLMREVYAEVYGRFPSPS